jgi:hypothetical protein
MSAYLFHYFFFYKWKIKNIYLVTLISSRKNDHFLRPPLTPPSADGENARAQAATVGLPYRQSAEKGWGWGHEDVELDSTT